MPLAAIRAVSKGQNGVSSFIPPLRRLHFTYCDIYGSSRGMNAFLQHHLASFARKNPQVEIHVSPVPQKDPIIRAEYTNGNHQEIAARKMEPTKIFEVLKELKEGTGEPQRRYRKPVKSENESVRGVWSPFHGALYKV